MRGKLSAGHLSILLAIQERPLASAKEISEITGIPRGRVSSTLKWLMGETAEGGKKYFRVAPVLNEPSLGLETVDVFIEAPTLRQLKVFEHLCEKHPYTKYRARCYGKHRGIFIQFRIPIGTQDLLRECLDKKTDSTQGTSYEILPTSRSQLIRTHASLSKWDPNSFTWDFDWLTWFNTKPSGRKTRQTRMKTRLDLLTRRDIRILAQLARGVKRKQAQIIRALQEEGVHITSQDFSRRLKVLHEHFITEYQVFLDPDAFDLYSNVIITSECNSRKTSRIARRLKSQPIPFSSSFKTSGGFLFWYLRLPQSHLSALLNLLREQIETFDVTLIDYHMSQVYAPWYKAFDEARKMWRSDREFVAL
ncbi:MAG: hypothetical protein ACTSYL_03030 [Candidatus Thorarchaeota archaeon]